MFLLEDLGARNAMRGLFPVLMCSHMGGYQKGVPFWVLIIIRHPIFRVPKRDHNNDNHPYVERASRQTE